MAHQAGLDFPSSCPCSQFLVAQAGEFQGLVRFPGSQSHSGHRRTAPWRHAGKPASCTEKFRRDIQRGPGPPGETAPRRQGRAPGPSPLSWRRPDASPTTPSPPPAAAPARCRRAAGSPCRPSTASHPANSGGCCPRPCPQSGPGWGHSVRARANWWRKCPHPPNALWLSG